MDRRPTPAPQTTPTWEAGPRRRSWFYLVAAILFATLAGILTYTYLDNLRAATLPAKQALVARQDIEPGALIDATMVEVRPLPEAVLPEGFLTAAWQAEGRVALVPIASHELLLPGKLSGGPGAGLSARLPDGRWAMVLPAGWLASPIPKLVVGDRIELLACQAGQPQQEVGVIVSGVEVLDAPTDSTAPEWVTLAITLDQASSILYARVNGFTLLPLLRQQGAR